VDTPPTKQRLMLSCGTWDKLFSCVLGNTYFQILIGLLTYLILQTRLVEETKQEKTIEITIVQKVLLKTGFYMQILVLVLTMSKQFPTQFHLFDKRFAFQLYLQQRMT
jgi:hypothetical protein